MDSEVRFELRSASDVTQWYSRRLKDWFESDDGRSKSTLKLLTNALLLLKIFHKKLRTCAKSPPRSTQSSYCKWKLRSQHSSVQHSDRRFDVRLYRLDDKLDTQCKSGLSQNRSNESRPKGCPNWFWSWCERYRAAQGLRTGWSTEG